MKFLRGVGIQAQIKFVLPAKFKACFGQCVVADLSSRMSFGQICGVGSDFVSHDACFNIVSIG